MFLAYYIRQALLFKTKLNFKTKLYLYYVLIGKYVLFPSYLNKCNYFTIISYETRNINDASYDTSFFRFPDVVSKLRGNKLTYIHRLPLTTFCFVVAG